MALRTISLGYRVGSQWLLRDIDLTFAAGQLHVLLGANGAGKSSLLRALGGDVSPTIGDVLLDDQSLASFRLDDKAHRMAVLPQRSILDFPFLGRDVIEMGRYGHQESKSKTNDIVDEVIAALQLEQLSDQSYTMMSGGEQQRIQIARVFTQLWDDPGRAVYLLDEPDSPLDLAHQVSLFSLLEKIVGLGATVVLSTHDLNLAGRFADQVTLLKGGQLLATGKSEAVMTAENIYLAYGVPVAVRPDQSGRFKIDYPVE
jgi:iron complex transport system ATP-binding protein